MQALKNKKVVTKVSVGNLEILKEKKRKLRLNSIDDVISVLLEKEEEFSTLKKIKRKKIQNEPIDMVKEKPKIELPSLNGTCLFRTEREEGKINCAKDFKEKNVIHVLTKEQCNECWNNSFHVPINPESTKGLC